MPFIYVMSEADREKLLKLGYSLLKSDRANRVWIFSAGDGMDFSSEDQLTKAGVRYVLSNTLTF